MIFEKRHVEKKILEKMTGEKFQWCIIQKTKFQESLWICTPSHWLTGLEKIMKS